MMHEIQLKNIILSSRFGLKVVAFLKVNTRRLMLLDKKDLEEKLKSQEIYSEKAEIEIERICDSYYATVDRGKDYIDKIALALRNLDKIDSLVQAGKLEISNLKKKRKKEIEET